MLATCEKWGIGEGKGSIDVGDDSGVVVEADNRARAWKRVRKEKGESSTEIR